MVNMDEHGMWHNFDCPTKDKTMSICEVARKDQTRPTVQPTNPAQGSCFNGWVETVDRQSCLQVKQGNTLFTHRVVPYIKSIKWTMQQIK